MACTGLGLVQRGYERLFYDLYQLVRDQHDVTLFKGGGARSEREIVPLFADRNGLLVKLLPVHKLFGRTPYHSECMTFALGLLPYLRGGAFDVVHIIDPPLTRLLYRMRKMLGLRFRLLHTEAAAMAPSDYPPADYTHHISKATLDNALAYGYAPELMALIPCGVYPERFTVSEDRNTLRRNYGIPEDTFVILSVAALNRSHKRTDYLVEEVAKLEGNFLLLLDGSLDHGDPDLLPWAKAKLGERCRISHVPSDKVRELYALADIFIHGATYEAFGIALAEAASTGLPMIVHNAPHFQWLIPNPNCWIDALRPGELAEKLAAVMREPERLKTMSVRETMWKKFNWHVQKTDYSAMYRRVAALEPRNVPEFECRRILRGASESN
jgi:glycosyltransferase involved in cell wall biosynthesis